MQELRDRLEAYLVEMARAGLGFRSGRSRTLDLDPIDDRFPELCSGEWSEAARGESEGAFGADAREGARRLARALEEIAISARVRPRERELREREAAQIARVAGEEQRVFSWQSRLGSEPEALRRHQIQDAIDAAAGELNSLREELFRERLELRNVQGYATPRAWAEAQHPDLDYDLWGRHASEFLLATEAAYRDQLRRSLSGIGVDPSAAGRGDAARLSRLGEFDALFPAQRMRECLDFTLDGMGLRLDRVPAIRIDATARPGKNPRASCIAPKVPEEVWILLAPRGGVDDYETFFHEAGHALHHAFTSPELPVERRRLVEPALTESFAFLLHYRISDPAWMSEGPAADHSEAFAAALRLRKLALLRRYTAKIRYELELNALGADESCRSLSELYASELSEATGFGYRSESYLQDTDPDFYSVDYFRAWCLEVQLAEALRERFGRRFWKERRAGDLLKELWNTGGSYTAAQLARELGLGEIDPAPLIADLLRAS